MPDHAVTAQLTATTEVARAPASPRQYDEWGVTGLIAAGVVVLISTINGLVGIVDRFIAWRREGETEDLGQIGAAEARIEVKIQSVVERVEAVANDARRYRDAGDIDRDLARLGQTIEHNKTRQDESARAAAEMIREDRTRIGAVEQQQARLEAMVQSQTASIGDVKRGIERLDEKLDRIIGTRLQAA